MTTEVRDVSYDQLYVQWYPKLVKMSKRFLPYVDSDDIHQELSLVLWKCQQQFDSGRGATFHTYFHRAIVLRLMQMYRDITRHNPDFKSLVYLSSMQHDNEDEPESIVYGKYPDMYYELEDGAEMQLEVLGFNSIEIDWMLGRIDNLSIKEIAKVAEIAEDDVRQASKTAKRKIKEVRRRYLDG